MLFRSHNCLVRDRSSVERQIWAGLRPSAQEADGVAGDRWFLDEVLVAIQGQRRYLWRAVDRDGDRIEILVQRRQDTQAAKRFFREILGSQTQPAMEITTDKLRIYAAA